MRAFLMLHSLPPLAKVFGGAPCTVRALCEKKAILWKVTVAVDNLVNIVWVCPIFPGTSTNVKIWAMDYSEAEVSLVIRINQTNHSTNQERPCTTVQRIKKEPSICQSRLCP